MINGLQWVCNEISFPRESVSSIPLVDFVITKPSLDYETIQHMVREEEIPLMCSCNDCSRKRKKEERELPAFTSFGSLERNQSFESEVFCICSSPTPGHSSNSSELTQIPTGSLALTFEMSNCFDTLRPAVSRPFDSRVLCLPFCQRTSSVKADRGWCLREMLALLLRHCKTWERRSRRHLPSVPCAAHFIDWLFGKG